MFSNGKTMRFTDGYSDDIRRAGTWIQEAEAVVVGAGAGLSASAGFSYAGERFCRYFQDFIDRYGFEDMYSGGFYPFDSLEEHWAYWSRYIYINRYLEADNGTYRRLKELVKEKDYFVITTNVDHQFQKAGFDKERLFYTQGDYGLFQCSKPCHPAVYDNEDLVMRMVKEQKDMRIPSELVPYCPRCGRPMSMNLRADDTFVQDEGWYRACERYEKFLDRHRRGRIVFLELGVGMNTPVIIKYPFWQMTAQNPKAAYVCVNLGAAAPQEIRARSVCIDGDIGKVLECL